MLRIFICLIIWGLPAVAEPLPALPKGTHVDWQAIGRVNVAGFANRSMCTGTLIAPDLVLTAAHCVIDHMGRPLPVSKLHFVAGWHGGSYAAHSLASEVTLHPGAWKDGNLQIRHDMALLHLATPMKIIPLPVASAFARGKFALIGYYDWQPNRLSGRFDCRGRTGSGVIELACATRFGNSGGPILAKDPDGWKVVGVVSAGNQATTVGPIARDFAAP